MNDKTRSGGKSDIPFVSYAQNFEDVILWRALKDVGQGFYVDVGAFDPNQVSVTKAFYERGWRGMNIEPVSQWFEKLVQARPRDVNLQIAAGAHLGEAILYEIPHTGLSTFSREIAERHRRDLGYEFLEEPVPVAPLSELCRIHCPDQIHFMKIDVEGAEKDVLEGLDLTAIRPWILLVESTLPMLQTPDHGRWESLLLNARYDFVYFDGVNRFYLAREHEQLRAAFSAPPNYFDNFVLASERDAQRRAMTAERKAAEAEGRLSASRASTSHRIARPLRFFRRLVRQDPALKEWLGWQLRHGLRAQAKNAVRSLARQAMLNPLLRELSLRLFDRFPALKRRLRAMIIGGPRQRSPTPRTTPMMPVDCLSLRGRQVLLDLREERDRRRSRESQQKQRESVGES
jgi:FkbM family methyltransferase